jgi:hypothetical protein
MTMATHYESASKGRIEIGSMQFDHAQRTLAKLIREDGDPEVIDAIAAHVAAIEATFGDREPTL